MVAYLDFVVTHLLLYTVDLLEVLLDLLKSLDLPHDLRDLAANLCFLIPLANLFYFCYDFGADQIHRQVYLAETHVFLN